MTYEWNKGLIIDLDSDPFGHDAFTPFPGLVFRGPGGRNIGYVQRECLLTHERVHWVQQLATTVAAVLLVLFGLQQWGWPTWAFWLTPLAFPVLYLVFPPFKAAMECWADNVQEACVREMYTR